MDKQIAKTILDATMADEALRGVVLRDADVLEWMPDALRTSVGAAIELLLAELPRQPPVVVVQLMNGARANHIRQLHAARAVLMALVAMAEAAPKTPTE